MNKTELKTFLATFEKTADTLVEVIEQHTDAMREYMDEKSDRWREGDRGTEWEAAVEKLDGLVDELRTPPYDVDDLT